MNLPNEINKYWNYLEEKYPTKICESKKTKFFKIKKRNR